jgi:acetylglutamate kinase
MIYLLYIDDYHAGDPLFVQGLARELAQAGLAKPPCVLVHGSGEQAERLLEAQGLFPERAAGVWKTTSDQEALLVERAIREANRSLTNTLNDAVVSTVGLHGVNRRLLQANGDGDLHVHRPGWVQQLIQQGVVPVVSTLVAGPDGQPQEAPVHAVVQALQTMLEGPVTLVSFLRSSKPGLFEGDERIAQVEATALPPSEVVPDPAVVRAAAGVGGAVLLTTLYGFFDKEGPQGTYVQP